MTMPQQLQAKVMGFTLKNMLATTSLVLGLATASPAATVQCGVTIGPNVTMTFSGSMTCDNTAAAGLIIIGPVDVDMTNFELLCNDTNQDGVVPPGLFIQGQQAQVHGGFVSGCFYGVFVTGQGQHTVENVQVEFSRMSNFYVGSDKNTLRRNQATSGSVGFETGNHSHRNTLIKNIADGHTDDGFLIDGNKHRLQQNFASNSSDGFDISGGEGHTLTRNEAVENRFDGFDVQGGTKTTLRKNLALRNGGNGFQIGGLQHTLTQNQARKNKGDGIDVVASASRIELTENVARNNNQDASPTDFDLKDDNPDCSTNTWEENTFGTANQPCID